MKIDKNMFILNDLKWLHFRWTMNAVNFISLCFLARHHKQAKDLWHWFWDQQVRTESKYRHPWGVLGQGELFQILQNSLDPAG